MPTLLQMVELAIALNITHPRPSWIRTSKARFSQLIHVQNRRFLSRIINRPNTSMELTVRNLAFKYNLWPRPSRATNLTIRTCHWSVKTQSCMESAFRRKTPWFWRLIQSCRRCSKQQSRCWTKNQVFIMANYKLLEANESTIPWQSWLSSKPTSHLTALGNWPWLPIGDEPPKSRSLSGLMRTLRFWARKTIKKPNTKSSDKDFWKKYTS